MEETANGLFAERKERENEVEEIENLIESQRAANESLQNNLVTKFFRLSQTVFSFKFSKEETVTNIRWNAERCRKMVLQLLLHQTFKHITF